MRHIVKDLSCLYNVTALGIHVNKCIEDKPIIGKARTNDVAMHLFPKLNRPNSRTNFENPREGDGLGYRDEWLASGSRVDSDALFNRSFKVCDHSFKCLQFCLGMRSVMDKEWG
ncbi:hypothetical protein CR513_09807, partial [Mucuna pruriens]